MDFKTYYLLKERAHFVDLATLSDDIIDQLQEKLAKKKSINSGDKITVTIADVAELDIKLYKGYSRAALDHIAQYPHLKVEGIGALYFPKTENENGRIELYINTSKKSNNYYKERKFEDFINKSLPKYIKDMLRHEISHAYEDIISDVAQYSETENEDDSAYYNSDDEINAFLMQYLPGEIQHNAVVKHYLVLAHKAETPEQKAQDINTATEILLNKLASQAWVRELSKANKKWVMKTVYTYVAEFVDRAKASQ